MLRRRFLSLAPKLVAATAAPTLISSAFAQDGVSAKAIMIGSTCAMSGPLGGYGLSIKSGTQAAMQEINSKGGISGRQLQFLMLDDAYAPPRSVENFRQLIAGESILALLSCTGTGNNAALLPLVEEAGIPYVAPFTGAASLRKAGMRNVFHVRAGYTEEASRLVQKLIGMGISNLAVAYLDNVFGKEVLADTQSAMAIAKVKAVAEVAIATDGKNIAEAVAKIMAAKPAAVIMCTAGTASVTLTAALKQASPLMPIAGISVTYTADGLKQLGKSSQGLALTMVTPDHNHGSSKLVRDYQAAMRAAGQPSLDNVSLEAYANTRVLVEGIERAGRDVSRARLRVALASLRNLDLGGFNVDYAATPYVGSRYVNLGVMSASGNMIS
jgi:branched-chain amino acid transport system substrate-binding protein